MNSAAALLEFRDVGFRYPDGNVGLECCSLTVGRGSRNALIGANGAGKTTLFQHANGLLRPQSGQIFYAGAPIDYSRAGLRALRSEVGLVFQNPDQQLFSASVAEDVSFGPMNLGLDMATVRARVAASLAVVGMADYGGRPVHHLSFGQKKRACIAGVLAMEPKLMILDEPLAGLDCSMRAELLAVLEGLHASGMTLLLATHDINFAYAWADTIHLIDAGRCSTSFAAAELAREEAALAAVGQPLPAVIELQRRLAARGEIAPDAAPRNVAELLALLDAAPLTKGKPMTPKLPREAA